VKRAGERYQVRVEGVQFAAAHFATFGGECEPLHGHSYGVAAEVDGSLSEESWVVDFVQLKSILRGLCHTLDHRFMLQLNSRLLKIEAREGCWKIVTPGGRQYSFPEADVAALPIDNTTAERLAEWLCGRLQEALQKRGAANVDSILVEVWEGPGQRAAYRSFVVAATVGVDDNAVD
jgi:6-pyruvoyltetrahydropterin/6-carboxytetrahydropterin synthase